MTLLIGARVFAALLGSCLFIACTRSYSVAAPSAAPASSTAFRSDSARVTTEDPCGVLDDDEVSKVFPGAASGKRDSSLEAHGILVCAWDTPTDRFVVQVFDTDSGSVEDELRSRMSASIDKRIVDADRHIRYDRVSGVGDEAMLVLEKEHLKHGILADTAVMVTQRGKRRAVLFTGSSLTERDRASAHMALETLGRHVADNL